MGFTNGNDHNQDENVQVSTGGLHLTWPAVIFFISAIGIGGANSILQVTTGYRPDKHTQTERLQDIRDRETADLRIEAESKRRYNDVLDRIQKLSEAVEECRKYRERHGAESSKGFAIIRQQGRDIHRLKQLVDKVLGHPIHQTYNEE
jgi:hypothetical protein